MPSLKSFLTRLPLRLPRYLQVFRRFSGHTMIPKSIYLRNLALVHQFSGVQGTVVECGVWRGGMIAGLATLLGPKREYHLFDSFEGLPPAKEIDGQSALSWQADKNSPDYHNNCAAEEGFARRAMELSGAGNFTLHKGWFDHTLLPWAPSAAPIAILRLDCDWYDSMNVCLAALLPRLAPGGVLIVDDYYAWDGCAKSIHEHLAGLKKQLRIRQFLNGPCYVVNE